MFVAIRRALFILKELSLNQRKAVKLQQHHRAAAAVVVEDYALRWAAA
jgi:hypothetical protein